MSQLYNSKGEKLELESIKASFEGKVFLMLLHRSQGKDAENPRRLLLVSYYEDPAPQISPSMACNSGTLINRETSSTNYGPQADSPISPLKRQLSQIEITSDNNAKKALTWTEESKPHQDTSDADNTDDYSV
ncbi:hypothetical protein LIER_28339 [Lithospermum erythrorhizon]|uniref:Uncharacterized protein n=1 Tax=Lithospermum erythrorhizon TaxID=34254 RepID=A0AAV3RGG4_LITER